MKYRKKCKYIILAAIMFIFAAAFTGCSKNEKTPSEDDSVTKDYSEDKSESDSVTDDENTISDKGKKNMNVYVAIGDSLTHGFGLADKKNDRFSAIVTDKLNKANYQCIEYNYGVDGLTTEGLLDMIKQGEAGMLSEADIITIDIGANDVLDSMNPIIFAILESGSVTKYEYEQARVAYNNSILNSYDNTREILKLIRNENPNSQIIIATIYNPYKNIAFDIDIDGEKIQLSDYTDSMINDLNNNIRKIANEYNCKVADWYTAFSITKSDVLNARYEENNINFDIHPNKEGHNIMAAVVYEAIDKEQN